MTRVTLVVFDLDGTLFDGAPLTLEAFRGAFSSFGMAPPADDEILSLIGEPDEVAEAWFAGRAPAGVDAAALVEAADRRELELVRERGRCFPGVEEMLKGVRDLVEVMVMCTNGPPDYVEAALDRIGVTQWFEEVRPRVKGGPDKAAAVGELVAARGVRRGIVVGDRCHDVEAARANGLLAIGAGWGYGAEEELAAADTVAATPADVPALVELLIGT